MAIKIKLNDMKARHLSVMFSAEDERRIPLSIWNLKSLRTLLCGKSFGFEDLSLLSDLTSLRTLDLSWTDIKELPKEIEKLIHLRYLDLSSTGVEELPETVCNLSNLQTLKLNGCSDLRRLPDEIGKLVSLRHLEVESTKLEELAETVGNLSNLQTLILNWCSKLRKLPNDMGKMVSLRHLEAEYSGLEELPETVGNLSNLQTLKLTWCKNLQKLPNDMGKMVSLRHLEAEETKLEELPESISDLSNLQTLILKSCPNLRRLPNGIGKLINLRHLEAEWTKLEELPESISDLSNLQTLRLNWCEDLRRLLDDIGKMVSLRHFEFEGSWSLECFPRGIGKLKDLETLTNYNVSEEGSDIGELKHLNNLRGSLAISNIKGVVKEAILKDKEYLTHLILSFKINNDDDDEAVTSEEGSEFGELKHLNNLRGDDDEAVQSVLELLEPHPNLEELEIANYNGSKFPSWMEFPNWEGRSIMLRQLRIVSCKNLKVLPALGRLEFLEKLYLFGLHSVSQMGLEVLGVLKNGDSSAAPVIAFPNLKKLTIGDMKHWEE